MQAVVVIMLLLAAVSFVVKQSLSPTGWRVGWAIALSVAIGFSWPLAIAQSKTAIAAFLQSPSMMADVAVVVTVEVSLMMAYCISGATSLGTDRPRWHTRVLRWLLNIYPGVLSFLSLFSILVWLIFAMPGTSFARLSWMLGAATAIVMPLLSWLLSRLLPSRRTRIEMLFAVNVVLAALGVVATVNGRTAVVGTTSIQLPQLLTVVAITVAGSLVGMAFRKRRLKHKNN
ncbi:MAG: hypothetical protein IJ761_06515 [Bacteroidales bacterium]|nr:hypothetical protein [Bacteroidales bacterium]